MAVKFNGTNNYLTIVTRPQLKNVAGATIMCWFKMNAYPSVLAGLVAFSTGNSTTASRLSLSIDNVTSPARIGCRARALDNDVISTLTDNAAGNTLTTGIWYHGAIACDFSTKTGYLYLNGDAHTSGTLTTMTAGNTSNNDSQHASIGALPGANNFLNADIEDARVYSRVLSAAEIKDIYTTRTQTPTNVYGLVGHYHLNENTGTLANGSAKDLSSVASALNVAGTAPVYSAGVLRGV